MHTFEGHRFILVLQFHLLKDALFDFHPLSFCEYSAVCTCFQDQAMYHWVKGFFTDNSSSEGHWSMDPLQRNLFVAISTIQYLHFHVLINFREMAMTSVCAEKRICFAIGKIQSLIS